MLKNIRSLWSNLFERKYWSVVISDNSISISNPARQTYEFAKTELRGVGLQTISNLMGPDRQWWLLYRTGYPEPIIVPQDDDNVSALNEYLTELSGFDHRSYLNIDHQADQAVMLWHRCP